MKTIKNCFIDLRYNMVAPKIYLKLLKRYVLIWWGTKNGGLEWKVE